MTIDRRTPGTRPEHAARCLPRARDRSSRAWQTPGRRIRQRGDPRRGVGGHGPRRGRRMSRRGRARDDRVRAAGPARMRRGGVPRAGGRRGVRSSASPDIRSASSPRWWRPECVPLGDALDLVVVRGAAMQRAGEERPGTMTALLGMGAEDAAALCDEARRDDVLVVANENSPAQSVISGSVPAIERAEALAKERKVRADPVARRRRVPLAADGTGAPAAIDERIDAIDVLGAAVPGRRERRPARWCPTRRSSGRSLKRHVISPVRWESSVRALADAGADLVPRSRSRRRPHQADEADRARRGGARDRLAGGRARRRVGHRHPRTAAMLAPVTRSATITGVGSSLPPSARPEHVVRGQGGDERRVDPRADRHRGPPLRGRRRRHLRPRGRGRAGGDGDRRDHPGAARHDHRGERHRRHPVPRRPRCGPRRSSGSARRHST